MHKLELSLHKLELSLPCLTLKIKLAALLCLFFVRCNFLVTEAATAANAVATELQGNEDPEDNEKDKRKHVRGVVAVLRIRGVFVVPFGVVP